MNQPGEDRKGGCGCRSSEVADRPARRRALRTNGYLITRTLSKSEVALLLDVSVQAVDQLETKTLKKLATLIGRDALEDLYTAPTSHSRTAGRDHE